MTIYGIIGGIGSGKTMTLVYLGLMDLYDGKTLYTNITLKNIGAFKKKVIYLTKDVLNNIFEKVKNKEIDMRNSTVLIQEAHNYIDSRNSNTKRNKTFGYWILQSRHTGRGTCDILYDTQELIQVDKRLRNNTDYQIRPTIIENVLLNNKIVVPSKIKIELTGKVKHKYRRMKSIIDCTGVIGKYDTHELVDF